MGLDPLTHKPIKRNTFEDYGGGGHHVQSKDTINMDHVAQWENARLEAEARGSMLQVESHSSHHPQLMLSKIPVQLSPSSSDSLSTKHNTVCNMYDLIFAENHDLPSEVSTLSIPNMKQFTDTGTSLSSEGDFNVTETSFQIIEDRVSNLEDDDDITMAVEAFTTERCESIQELLRGSTLTW